MRYALAFCLTFIASGAFAQKRGAARAFFDNVAQCGSSLGGWKCLELDLTSEAFVENDSIKDYEYSWSFGDGNRKQGNKVEHCYDAFGSYQVTMDLIDSETNTVMRNELSSTVQLYPEIRPEISTRTENLPPSFVEFRCTYNDADKFKPDRIYWRIDGSYYEGNTIVHAFGVAGVYLVEMGLEKDTDLFGIVTACAQTEITIKESDVWTARLSQFFEKARQETKTGPFAISDLFCLVRSVNGEEMRTVSLIPLNALMLEVHLEGEREYELMLIGGNAFTRKKKLSTVGIAGSDLYKALKDSISSFSRQPLIFFPSIRFEKNQVTRPADLSALKEAADLLLKYDFLNVEIGAYIHTGSRTFKGVETCVQRAQIVRDVLLEYGVDAKRISITSPEHSRSLMNTCSVDPGCDREQKALNGLVELKISGTNL